jgi:hypothetical protein
VVASRTFLDFHITNTVGGAWSGRASFDHPGANRLSGQLTAKNGDDVPIQLRKIVQ